MNESPFETSKVEDFDDEENFGIDEPTGSAKKTYLIKVKALPYCRCGGPLSWTIKIVWHSFLYFESQNR